MCLSHKHENLNLIPKKQTKGQAWEYALVTSVLERKQEAPWSLLANQLDPDDAGQVSEGSCSFLRMAAGAALWPPDTHKHKGKVQ